MTQPAPVDGAAEARGAPAAAPRPAGVGLYVHWPFCLSKCPYCDFNSHVRDGVDQARWRRALLAELRRVASETDDRPLASIFFGGGTPSLMAPDTVAAVVAEAVSRWRPGPDLEITLEANPGAVDTARFAALRDAGINRVSLGVQSMNDAALTFLGRGHDARAALRAVDEARRLFPRHSFDLIYARPGQDVQGWRRELGRALPYAGDHLSLYQLTMEPGTAFHTTWRKGDLVLPDDDMAAALYETTQEVLENAGLPAYEISNHAAPGGECRHNLIYWRYGDYAGIGPGAHGRLTGAGGKVATRCVRLPERWLEAVEARGSGEDARTVLAPSERVEEMLLMGLRLTEGVGRARFRAETGRAPEEVLDRENLERLATLGLIVHDDRGLRATAAGRLRLDAVIARLLP